MERATRSCKFDRLFSAKVKYRLEIYSPSTLLTLSEFILRAVLDKQSFVFFC